MGTLQEALSVLRTKANTKKFIGLYMRRVRWLARFPVPVTYSTIIVRTLANMGYWRTGMGKYL